jgi:hypothetical protein
LPDVVVQAAKANDGARLHLGTTGADGRVELPHAQILAGGEASLAVRVYAVPPGGETPSLDCDLTAPPPEIIVRVAGRGSLTVRLLDARDAPVDPAYLGDRSVWLAAFDEGPVAHARMAEGFNRQKWVATVGPQGIARFSGVALGRYLVVRSGNFGMTAGCIGPTAANPDVQVNLQEPADAAVVIGAVLAADGSPFADQRLSVMYRAGLSSGWTDTLTDGEGRMRCLLGAHCVGEDVTVSAGTPTHRTDDAAELRVELPSRTIRPGLNDLGTVRLAAPAVLVAGRLVRADGVEAARVQLSIERRAGRSWHQVWELRPEWKPDGSFTVQGAIPTGTPLRLKIGPGSHLPVAPIECQAGAREVEIHLRAAGTVTATFLVDENTRAERLGFDLRRTQPPEDRDERWRRTLDVWSLGSRASGGRVERKWSGLVPGTYDLAVLCRGQAEPITELQSIAVGGRPCKDPRLKGIDLRNRIHEFEVRVSGRGGKLITDRDALVVVRNAHGTWYGYTLHKGVVTLDTSSSLDLMVLAPGYRTAVIEKVREARTIALEPEPTCALKVSLPAALPDGIELQLDLRPQLRAGRDAYIRIDNGRGGQVESILAEKVVLGGDGTATLSPHIPGEYSVGVTLRSQGGRAASVVTDVVPRSISLPAATPVVLRVGADALQNALQRLRRN